MRVKASSTRHFAESSNKMVTGFSALKHSTVEPKAFTEKGLYMLATILKRSRATNATFTIIETFAKLRELSRIFKVVIKFF